MPIPSRFSPSESPPDASLVCLSAPSAPLAVSRSVQRTRRLSSRDSCSRQVRTILFSVTRIRWSLLSWCLPLRGLPRSVSTPLQAPPLMGFNMTLILSRSPSSSSCVLCRVSKNREVFELFRVQLPPWGFQSGCSAKAEPFGLPPATLIRADRHPGLCGSPEAVATPSRHKKNHVF